MKKIVSILLLACLLATIVSTCFAAAHIHIPSTVEEVVMWDKNQHVYKTVSGCHFCTYSHKHEIRQYYTIWNIKCYCDEIIKCYSSNVYDGPEYCPYNHY